MILSLLRRRGCLRLVELEVLLIRWRRHGRRRVVTLRGAMRMIPNLRRRSRLLLGRCRVVNWRRLVRNLGRWCMLGRRRIAHSLPSLWWRLGLRRRRIVHSLSGLRRRLRLRWRRIELCLVRWRRSRRRRILAMLLLLLRSCSDILWLEVMIRWRWYESFANLGSFVPRRAELLRCHDQLGCHDEHQMVGGTYEDNSGSP